MTDLMIWFNLFFRIHYLQNIFLVVLVVSVWITMASNSQLWLTLKMKIDFSNQSFLDDGNIPHSSGFMGFMMMIPVLYEWIILHNSQWPYIIHNKSPQNELFFKKLYFCSFMKKGFNFIMNEWIQFVYQIGSR